jgi:GNAT superfamily N-acetyltransferase
MTTIRERCNQIKERSELVIITGPALGPLERVVVEQPAPPVAEQTSPVDFQVLVKHIDSELPTSANIIALWHGQLVASLGLRLREPGGFVHSVYVLPNYRGQGLAEQLLRLAAVVAEEHGKPTIGLSVHRDNVSAQRLYHRLGFRPFVPTQGSNTSTTWVAMLPLIDEIKHQ